MKKMLIAGIVLLCALPTLSQASGFALIELNARGQGNAFAGASAHTPDASTVYFNPAGMMLLQDDQIAAAAHVVMPKSSFNDDGSKSSDLLGGAPLTGTDDDGGSNAFVPNFYWVTALNEDMKFGLGVNAPFGLATKYDDTWRGRYHGVVSDLRTININPSLGYRVNDKMSVGGGLNVMLADVDLSSAIDFGAICIASFNPATCAGLGSLPQQADGFAELEGDNFDDLGLGFNFGLLYEISSQTSVGAAFRSEVDLKVSGDAKFKVPASSSFVFANNAFIDTGLKADVTTPASLSVSLSHSRDQITYLADITWTGWSSFDELRVKYDNPDQPDSVTTEDWNNTLRYSFGIDYQYTDKLVLRSGVAYDETPVPSAERRTPRLPGNDRTWLSFGASYQYSQQLSFDVGYSHLFIDDPKINNEFESSIPTLASTLKGDYQASVDIISAQLNWHYE
jgi:long-chain fatty acid transport protein